MTYRNYRRSRPVPRAITVKYAGKCGCCGVKIKTGEIATYYPPGSITGALAGSITHLQDRNGDSARCAQEIRRREYPEYAAESEAKAAEYRSRYVMNSAEYREREERERAAVNDYAGDGLDERYEDDCRERCGL